MLNTVRMPISFRGPTACFIAWCRSGAKRNPILALPMHVSTVPMPASMFTPSSLSTSALPHRLDDALLPCLATFSPAPAATMAAAVEMLKVSRASPPVPQVSTTISSSTVILTALLRIARAHPVISSTVSLFIRNAVRNAAICAPVADPSIICVMTSWLSSKLRF